MAIKFLKCKKLKINFGIYSDIFLMSYKPSDFNKCMFPPLCEKTMLETYPRLKEIIIPEYNVSNIDAILRYISLMYDPKSPLVTTERELNYRKGVAAQLSGLDLQDNELMVSIYTFTHDFLSDLVIRFLTRFTRSMEWAAILVVENCFWESAKKLMEPIDGKDSKAQLEAVQKKSAIKDELDKDIIRLEKYWKNFFGEDDELEKKAKGRTSPEFYASLTNSTT